MRELSPGRQVRGLTKQSSQAVGVNVIDQTGDDGGGLAWEADGVSAKSHGTGETRLGDLACKHGADPGAGAATSTTAASLIVGATPTYYPVSDSQNPLGLEGEIEAYGPMTAVADFNHDGKSDLIWQNTVTGECNVWLMNGTAFLAGAALPSAGGDWRIRN